MLGTYRDDELERGRPLTDAIGPLVRDVRAVDLHPRLLTVDERPRLVLDPPQMIGSPETLRVDLVDVLGPGGRNNFV